MKRGDIVLIRQHGTPASKARPCVIVQRDSSLPAATKISACTLTTQLRGAAGQRPFVAPTPENGLRRPSEVQVDWIYTHPIEWIEGVVGTIDVETMSQVDAALRRWVDL